VLAPAFVGSHARIHANAVLTRCSVVERRAEIGMGSVVEDATVMPYTCVGAGLDVAHAVAGSGRLASLEHEIEIEISDPRLLRVLPHKLGPRVLARAASVLSFLLPSQVSQRLARIGRAKSAELPEAVATASAIHTPAGFSAGTSAIQVSSRSWQ
jgi:NDP-sugar pyrophosphorylase family protein